MLNDVPAVTVSTSDPYFPPVREDGSIADRHGRRHSLQAEKAIDNHKARYYDMCHVKNAPVHFHTVADGHLAWERGNPRMHHSADHQRSAGGRTGTSSVIQQM